MNPVAPVSAMSGMATLVRFCGGPAVRPADGAWTIDDFARVCVERLGLARPGTAAQKRDKAFSEKVDTALPKEKAANTESIELFADGAAVNVKCSKPFGV